MRIILLLLLLSPIFSIKAQENPCKLEGRIIDEEGKAIPYTSLFIPKLSQGAMANIDGEFSVSLPCGVYQLKVQSMGFQSKQIQIELSRNQKVDIELKTATYQLGEVVVDPDSEDPAYNIMRKATAMSQYYKEQINAYTAKLYVRSFYDVEDIPWIAEKMAEEDELAEMKAGDVTETILEYSYRKPNEVKEKILARKSGSVDTFKTSSSYINLNFYNLGGTDMINPLSRGAFAVYEFEYLNTVFEEGNKVHKIKITPKRRGNDLMKGFIYINDGIWNINKVDVEFSQPMAEMEYKQIYNEVEPMVWMPSNHKIRVGVSLMGFKVHVQYLATLSELTVETDSIIDQRIRENISKTTYDTTKAEKQLPSKQADKEKSKRQEKIDELLQKEELNKRETFKLVRLIKQEGEERAKDDSLKSLELMTMKKVEYHDSAFVRNDSLWESMRQIPLSSTETKIYQNRDSLNKIKSGDTIINRDRSLVGDLLFYNGIMRGKNKKLHFEPKGLLSGLMANYNTVDGWLIDKKLFTIRKDDYRGKKWSLTPTLSYAVARKTFMGQIDFEGQYDPKKRAGFYGAVGRNSSDYNSDHALVDELNSISSLVFTENYKKLFQQDFITLGHKTDLANGLVLDVSLEYADRQPLRNYSTQKWFDFMANDYTVNVPSHEVSYTQPELIGFNKAFNVEAKLEYTPEHYYRFLGAEKQMLQSDYPTFGLTYKSGIPDVAESQGDYHFLSFSIEQRFDFRLIDRIDYKVEAGKFLSAKQLYFADYHNFSVNPAYLMANNNYNSFKLLDYYAYNSRDYYLEGHLSVENDHLALKYLPLLNRTNWNEKIELNYLYTEREKHFYELGYSLNRIFLFMNVGAYVSFEDDNYQSFGVRVGLNLEDF